VRLFLVELRRLWSRRITWVTLLVVALLMVLFVGIGFTQTSAEEPDFDAVSINLDCQETLSSFRDDGDPEFQGMTDEEIGREYCQQGVEDRRFFATEILGGFGDAGDWSEQRDQQQELPTREVRIDGETYREARTGLEGVIPVIGTFLLIIAVVLGGSFVGAEYRSGTVENLLLWEPRRIKVMLTKYGAGFVSAVVVMAVLLMFLTVLLLALAQFRGTFTGIDSTFWVDWIATVGRVGLVAGFYFILAMAIAAIARNTTAAVVAVLGWFVVSNILIELFAKWFRQYELFTNAASFIGMGEVVRYRGSGIQQQLVYSHGPWFALAIVAVWAFIPGLIALLLFRRRDLS
jgi:ABC-2 type transport system permease protein